MIRVRLFAALRDAAGAAVVEVEATTVAGMLTELGDRHGELMQRRLQTAIVSVDGETLPRTDTSHDLSRAEEIVVMPPFAGG